ncbi:GCG_CRPN prefix-to-repeats domain-containing protein [Methylorubrum extorquens]|uniref:GCG_CRPN prefix-to-repeats domain-containing protein n=1 Tax=Methylorubrum sp. GM97 TaxID=2938232 RepID=UPI003965AEB8
MTRASRLMTLCAAAFVVFLGIGPLQQGRIGIGRAEAAGGCGLGFHRGPYGGCRPNGYGGYYGRPGYYGYRGGAVYGYRGGAYGYRGARVHGGRAVYGRRGGGFHGGRAVHGGGRFRR